MRLDKADGTRQFPGSGAPMIGPGRDKTMTAIPAARAILEKLISFPTVSRDTNLPLVDYAENLLQAYGIATGRVMSACGTKAHLHAMAGPAVEGGIVLSGHTDVVPVDGQSWATDPFTLSERDGKLFGRGTCDMKGFDALAIAAMLKAAGRPLARPLQLALSFNEEVGCMAVIDLVEAIGKRLPRASAAIIGEPTMMKAVTGHKGGAAYDVHVKGFEVHSSLLPEGVSAIMEAARLIEWFNGQNRALQAAAPGPLAAAFNPPFTTLHVGKISGGTAHNITARDCRFIAEMRVVPGEDVEEWARRFEEEAARFDAELKARRPEAGVDIVRTFTVPALVPENDGFAETLVRRLTGDNGTHVVSYGTEAGQFQLRGWSAIVCGPGDIAQAHQADEFLTVEQFEAGERFLDDVIETLTA